MRLDKQPRIVGCVATEAALRRYSKAPPPDCDWLEVRLDLVGFCGGQWANLCSDVQKRGRPVLLTIRSTREGGQWRGREADRLALYEAGLRSVSAVDMEIGAAALGKMAKAAHALGVRVVGSFHDFKGTPGRARLRTVESKGRRLGADIVKIATTVRTSADLSRLFALPAEATGPICVLGMGDRGAISRVALPCAGSCLAYGALDAATAPGQPTCRQLAKDLVRWGVRSA
jgi:3-dehydroquinate dehydratase I